MFEKKLFTVDGRIVYPSYLSQADRAQLFLSHVGESHYMYCACSKDTPLYYKISKDLRIYPEKNEYASMHSGLCLYNKEYAGRKPYMIDEESGKIVVRLRFNPMNFSFPVRKPQCDEDKSEENGTLLDETADNAEEILSFETSDCVSEVSEKNKRPTSNAKSIKLSLFEFFRELSLDTFNERSIQGKSLLSCSYFSSCMMSRLGSVLISGMTKNIRQYSLESDGFQIFFMRYRGFIQTVKDCEGTFIGEYFNDIRPSAVLEEGSKSSFFLKAYTPDGKELRWFIPDAILEKAREGFFTRYGTYPERFIGSDETNASTGASEALSLLLNNVYCGGFRYLQKSKRSGSKYRIVGRLVIFCMSRHGLIGRNTTELANLNDIINYSEDKGKLLFGEEPYAAFQKDFHFITSDGVRRLTERSLPSFIVSANADKSAFSLNGRETVHLDPLRERISVSALERFIH